MSDTHVEIVAFGDAVVGQFTYTWENADGDWGDYTFETVDPASIYSRHDFGDPELCVPIIRKRWLLVEVTEYQLFEPEDGDDE